MQEKQSAGKVTLFWLRVKFRLCCLLILTLFIKNLSMRFAKLYPIINGKWHSLKTGEDIEFNLKVKDFGKTANERLATSQVNGIYILSKTEPFANLSFWDYENKERKKLLIIPATYIHDNQEENVLVMYVDYEFLGFNSQEKDFGYAQNLRIDNIKTATDVLIKKI